MLLYVFKSVQSVSGCVFCVGCLGRSTGSRATWGVKSWVEYPGGFGEVFRD